MSFLILFSPHRYDVKIRINGRPIDLSHQDFGYILFGSPKETAEQATVDVMDAYVQAKLANAETLAPGVRSVVARLTEAPTK